MGFRKHNDAVFQETTLGKSPKCYMFVHRNENKRGRIPPWGHRSSAQGLTENVPRRTVKHLPVRWQHFPCSGSILVSPLGLASRWTRPNCNSDECWLAIVYLGIQFRPRENNHKFKKASVIIAARRWPVKGIWLQSVNMNDEVIITPASFSTH